MRNIVLIGLHGKAGSGKDFIGDILCKKYGFKRFAFADPLKEHCKKDHGWDGKKDDNGRKLLQIEGTEKHRTNNENVWLDRLDKDIDLAVDDGYNRFVITDSRFPNELAYVRANGLAVQVIGRGGLANESAKHSSETALDGEIFEFIFDNGEDVSQSDFDSRIEEMVRIVEK